MNNPTSTNRRNNNNQNKSGTDTNQKPYIIVPYQRGLSESFKRTCANHGVQVYFKGGRTIKKPPDGSKGSRSYKKQKWSHLQILSATGLSVMMNT